MLYTVFLQCFFTPKIKKETLWDLSAHSVGPLLFYSVLRRECP